MRFLCWLGFHRRSRSQVRHDGEDFLSACRRCGAPMRRDLDGRWRVSRSLPL